MMHSDMFWSLFIFCGLSTLDLESKYVSRYDNEHGGLPPSHPRLSPAPCRLTRETAREPELTQIKSGKRLCRGNNNNNERKKERRRKKE